jgi:hypothetical protein
VYFVQLSGVFVRFRAYFSDTDTMISRDILIANGNFGSSAF